jgi:hypothetical protein
VADAFAVGPYMADNFDSDSTESLYGFEDENGEELDEGNFGQDGNSDTGDGQQGRWPVCFMSEREGDGLI